MVSADIPVIGSKEIGWLNFWYKEPDPTDADDIVWFLYLAYYGKKIGLQNLNKIGLELYNYKAMTAWMELFFPNIS